MDTRYQIDDTDRVVSYDAAWIAFAEANAATSLVHRVLGQQLWTFIADPSVRELYRTLLQRVRTTGRSTTFPFRCDSPDVQRFMTLTIGTGEGPRGTLAFRASLVRETVQPETARALYESLAAHDSGYRRSVAHLGAAQVDEVPLMMCSWCKRLDVDGWCEIEVAVADRALLLTAPVRAISHGICPACHHSLLEAVA